MTYRSLQKRKHRIENEKAKSMSRYEEQKTAIEYINKSAQIIWVLSKMTYSARFLNPSDIVQKVNSGQELDFYHRWCCHVL